MSTTDQAISKIRSLIAAGTIKPGERIPSEAELVTQLGISRSSLREALRALSYLNVLQVRHGDGTYVSIPTPENITRCLSETVGFALHDSVIELFEIRRLLESAATAAAATRIREEALERLQQMIERMERSDEPEQVVAADAAFHGAILHASGNEMLAALVGNLEAQTVRARLWHAAAREGAVARSHAGHRAILEALQARDPKLAEALAATHIAEGEAWLRNMAQEGTETSWAGDTR